MVFVWHPLVIVFFTRYNIPRKKRAVSVNIKEIAKILSSYLKQLQKKSHPHHVSPIPM